MQVADFDILFDALFELNSAKPLINPFILMRNFW